MDHITINVHETLALIRFGYKRGFGAGVIFSAGTYVVVKTIKASYPYMIKSLVSKEAQKR